MRTDQVSEILRELTGEIMLPRFRQLSAAQMSEKTPGDWVTVVDHEMESALAGRLTELLPASIVVGEESAAADPSRLENLGEELVWVVDPLDGTNNFIAGSPDFATMVVLLRHGEPVASWIYAPVHDLLSVAEAGSGAWQNGERVRLEAPSSGPGDVPAGVFYTRYLPEELREALAARVGGAVEQRTPRSAAGIEYPRLLAGQTDFILYWRTLPWDHLPGSLMVREAGGVAAHFNGAPYTGADGRKGLLIARSPAQWDWLQNTLALGSV